MAREERRAVRTRLARSEVQHLVTVRALQKGFDAPVLKYRKLLDKMDSLEKRIEAIENDRRTRLDE
jgi:hypothetical protein